MLLNLPTILSSNSFLFYLLFLFLFFFILIYSLPKAKNQASYSSKLHNAPSITLYLWSIAMLYCIIYSLFVESKHY